jgi:hypothetical protein
MSAIYILDPRTGKHRLAGQIDFDDAMQAAEADTAFRLLLARIAGEANISNRRRMIAAALEAVSTAMRV